MRRARTIAAWILLVGSLIGWPISQLTFARHEPVLTLSLSWLAIVLVAADLLTTSQVAERSGSPEPRKEPRCPERKTTL